MNRSSILFAVFIFLGFLFSRTVFAEESLDYSEYELDSGEQSTLIHGYGELHYNRPDGGRDTKMDFHRMVIGLSHSYNNKITLHVEVDYEHASQEMELEFAYIDFTINELVNIRAGAVLMPIGYLNEYHEPPLFYSVERPYLQKYVIPTTWQEGGIGIFGTLAKTIKYRLYLVSGLDASGFDTRNGIRGGRGKIDKAKSEDMAIAGRLEYMELAGLKSGLSFYGGNADQGDTSLEGAAVKIVEVDTIYKISSLEIKGLYVWTDISAADIISRKLGKTIAERISGYNIEAAYSLSNLIGLEHNLTTMVRYEKFDTQDKVPSGFTAADPKADRKILTFAVSYLPIPDVAVKADYEKWVDGTDSHSNQFNMAVAYMF